MPESKLENLNLQYDTNNSKMEKVFTNLKIRLFNAQSLGLKYYMSSISYEVITIIISLFQLLSFSFYENVYILIINYFSLKIYKNLINYIIFLLLFLVILTYLNFLLIMKKYILYVYIS